MWSIALGCGLVLSAALAAPPAGPPQSALWRTQRLDFRYPGRTVRYSCDGLRDKLRAILLELGARRDLSVDTAGCDQRAPRLILLFSAPVPGSPDPTAGDAAERAPLAARYETFLLTSDALHNFGPADCELIDEFTRQVLPQLTTRGVESSIDCLPYRQTVPYQPAGSHYAVRGEILRALPHTES